MDMRKPSFLRVLASGWPTGGIQTPTRSMRSHFPESDSAALRCDKGAIRGTPDVVESEICCLASKGVASWSRKGHGRRRKRPGSSGGPSRRPSRCRPNSTLDALRVSSACQVNTGDYVSASRLNLWLRCPSALRSSHLDGVAFPANPSLLLRQVVYNLLEYDSRHRTRAVTLSAFEVSGHLTAIWAPSIDKAKVVLESSAHEQRLPVTSERSDSPSKFVEKGHMVGSVFRSSRGWCGVRRGSKEGCRGPPCAVCYLHVCRAAKPTCL